MRGPMTKADATPSRTSSGPGTPRTVDGETNRNGSAIASSARTTTPTAMARTLDVRNRGPIPGTLIAVSPVGPPTRSADHMPGPVSVPVAPGGVATPDGGAGPAGPAPPSSRGSVEVAGVRCGHHRVRERPQAVALRERHELRPLDRDLRCRAVEVEQRHQVADRRTVLRDVRVRPGDGVRQVVEAMARER